MAGFSSVFIAYIIGPNLVPRVSFSFESKFHIFDIKGEKRPWEPGFIGPFRVDPDNAYIKWRFCKPAFNAAFSIPLWELSKKEQLCTHKKNRYCTFELVFCSFT